MRQLLILSLFFPLCFSSFGQSLEVVSVFPPPQSIAAGAEAPVRIIFNQEVAQESIGPLSVSVFGRWSGPATGVFTLSEDGTEIIFTPDEPFFAGEWITVSLSRHIESMSGERLSKGFSWNYWIATAPGSLIQEPAGAISLRRPGEDLLQSYGAYAGDLNNDGYSDLTVVNETSDDLRILLNDGTGNYPGFEVIAMGALSPSPSEGGDFNKDGQIDLAVSTAHHDRVRILFGDGLGSFSDPDSYTTGMGARGLAVLDCNADGFDDIFITNRLDDNMSLLINTGDGSFEVNTLNSEGVGETACAATDANNDGIPDLFVGMYESRELAILLGQGDGDFQLSGKISVEGNPWMVAVGDLNGDSRADMASVNSSGHSTTVAFGDGDGGFGEVKHYTSPNAFFPLAVDLGDLDGDGDLDIVTSNYTSANYTVYENLGSGQFTPAIHLAVPHHASCAILHDRDNDGDLDISGTDEGDDVILLFNNPGSPSIAPEKMMAEIALGVSPNPFSDQVWIDFTLPDPQRINVQILDKTGRLIRSLAAGRLAAGPHQLEWNGTNNSGRPVTGGVYFILLQAGSDEYIRRVVKI